MSAGGWVPVGPIISGWLKGRDFRKDCLWPSRVGWGTWPNTPPFNPFLITESLTKGALQCTAPQRGLTMHCTPKGPYNTHPKGALQCTAPQRGLTTRTPIPKLMRGK